MVHLDPMEMGKGPQQSKNYKKINVSRDCIAWFKKESILIDKATGSGKIDLVAKKTDGHIYYIEVEGDSSKQTEQAVYSALGQLIFKMKQFDKKVTYAIAAPNSDTWKANLIKIPIEVCAKLNITRYLVAQNAVITI